MNAEEIARKLGNGHEKRQGKGWITCCPAHDDHNPSMSIRDTADGGVAYKCFSGCDSKAVHAALVDLGCINKQLRGKRGMGQVVPWKSRKKPSDRLYADQKGHKFTKAWEWRTVDGDLAGYTYRFERENDDGTRSKQILPVNFDGNNWGFGSLPRPVTLFNAHKLNKDRSLPVLIVEGEKAADAAAIRFEGRCVVTTWAGGTGQVGQANWDCLFGRTVIIWPDNDAPGIKAARQVAAKCVAAQVRSVAIVKLDDRLPPKWDLGDRLLTELEEDIGLWDCIVNAPAYDPTEATCDDPTVNQINKDWATIEVGGQVLVADMRGNKETFETIALYSTSQAENIKELACMEPFLDGKKEITAFKWWLRSPHRRNYRGIVFRPGITDDVNGNYNLFDGWPIQPRRDAGTWNIFKTHLLKNCCNGDTETYAWLMAWIADIFQNPMDKKGTAVILQGTQGTGKSTVGDIIGHLLNNYYMMTGDRDDIVGAFTDHFMGKLLVQLDEAFFPGDHSGVNKLKSLITSKNMMINGKFKGKFRTSDMHARFIMTSDQDWVIQAQSKERRYLVLKMAENNTEDHAFFGAMYEELEAGGWEAMMAELMEYPVHKYNLRMAPRTKELSLQQQMSLRGEDRWWYECLCNGNIVEWRLWGDKTPFVEMERAYLEWSKNKPTYERGGKSRLAQVLKKYIPAGKGFMKGQDHKMVSMRMFQGELKKDPSVSRPMCWTMPSLEDCRDFWDDLYGAGTEWEEIDVGSKAETHIVGDYIPQDRADWEH